MECEATLYLGSALFLLGRDGEALAALERAERTCSGSFLFEVRWQLVQVRLATGRRDAALETLDELRVDGGHRAVDAERLAGEVRGLRGE